MFAIPKTGVPMKNNSFCSDFFQEHCYNNTQHIISIMRNAFALLLHE